MRNPFRYFKTSPDIIRLAVMMYIRFPLSWRQVEDLLHERGIDVSYETVRAWWNRFGPLFAAEIRKKRSASMRRRMQWHWHLDEVFVRISGEGVVKLKRAGVKMWWCDRLQASRDRPSFSAVERVSLKRCRA